MNFNERPEHRRIKRVIGIGNALTDMLVNLKTDSVLGRFKLAKGSMSLVDTYLQTEISKSVAGLPYSLSLGGSAGNTIRAMARLGCYHVQFNVVGRDTLEDAVEHPQDHQDLLVRVAGYSAYFTQLRPESQQMIIDRTELSAW